MPTWKYSLKQTALTVYVILIIILLGYAVGYAAMGKVLVQAAFPLSIAVIGAFRLLNPKAESVAWAGLTAWLGMTYAHTGSMVEIAVFFLYVALGALGIFRSSWFLVFPWFAHIAWDFLPRTLPAMYHELPVACALYDGPIGLYLAWYSWRQRWQPFTPAQPPPPATL